VVMIVSCFDFHVFVPFHGAEVERVMCKVWSCAMNGAPPTVSRGDEVLGKVCSSSTTLFVGPAMFFHGGPIVGSSIHGALLMQCPSSLTSPFFSLRLDLRFSCGVG